MKQSKTPIWKKSILADLSLSQIYDHLYEINDNGDCFGYDRDEDGYYQDYKELFDELAAGAYDLMEAMDETDLDEHWDDMTVALLGYRERVLGYDSIEADYFGMLCCEENWAADEASKRIQRLTKDEMLRVFRKVMVVLVCYLEIKAAHDALTAIVDELDERGALLSAKNDIINDLYKDLTGANGATFDAMVENLPQRMWLE